MHQEIIYIKSSQGEYIFDKFNIAETINNYFCTVFEAKTKIIVLSVSDKYYQITEKHVREVLKCLKNSALGPDGIPNSFWGMFGNVHLDALTKLISCVINSGYVPDSWRCANVVSIY